jgi:uncharacterized membrane protein
VNTLLCIVISGAIASVGLSALRGPSDKGKGFLSTTLATIALAGVLFYLNFRFLHIGG